MQEIDTIIKKDFAAAEADRLFYQNLIEEQGEGGNLTAVTANLQRFGAGIIPTARYAEYLSASDDDKVRFFRVASRALNRHPADGDFITVFEEEYAKEFV